jgi:hypothetical protein
MDFWACYLALYQTGAMAPIISYPQSQWTLQCIFSKIEKAVQSITCCKMLQCHPFELWLSAHQDNVLGVKKG